jgi:type I restriction enzyme S subunit
MVRPLPLPGHEHTRILDGIPQGWERKTLIDVCGDLQDGDWIESKDQGGDDYRLLQVSNIGVNEFLETGNMRFISEETFRRLNCREVKPGQLLISRMPTPIGRAWLVTEMPWKMVTAVDVTILTANDDIADRYFLLHHLNSAETLQQSEGRAVGATRPRIARREFARIPVTVPPSPWQREFRDVVRPMNELRARLYQQNQKLRAARDLLLPRLMSGEMAVPGGP